MASCPVCHEHFACIETLQNTHIGICLASDSRIENNRHPCPVCGIPLASLHASVVWNDHVLRCVERVERDETRGRINAARQAFLDASSVPVSSSQQPSKSTHTGKSRKKTTKTTTHILSSDDEFRAVTKTVTKKVLRVVRPSHSSAAPHGKVSPVKSGKKAKDQNETSVVLGPELQHHLRDRYRRFLGVGGSVKVETDIKVEPRVKQEVGEDVGIMGPIDRTDDTYLDDEDETNLWNLAKVSADADPLFCTRLLSKYLRDEALIGDDGQANTPAPQSLVHSLNEGHFLEKEKADNKNQVRKDCIDDVEYAKKALDAMILDLRLEFNEFVSHCITIRNTVLCGMSTPVELDDDSDPAVPEQDVDPVVEATPSPTRIHAYALQSTEDIESPCRLAATASRAAPDSHTPVHIAETPVVPRTVLARHPPGEVLSPCLLGVPLTRPRSLAMNSWRIGELEKARCNELAMSDTESPCILTARGGSVGDAAAYRDALPSDPESPCVLTLVPPRAISPALWKSALLVEISDDSDVDGAPAPTTKAVARACSSKTEARICSTATQVEVGMQGLALRTPVKMHREGVVVAEAVAEGALSPGKRGREEAEAERAIRAVNALDVVMRAAVGVGGIAGNAGPVERTKLVTKGKSKGKKAKSGPSVKPDYKAMPVQELEKLAGKYGVRKMGKAALVAQLDKIWDALHPEAVALPVAEAPNQEVIPVGPAPKRKPRARKAKPVDVEEEQPLSIEEQIYEAVRGDPGLFRCFLRFQPVLFDDVLAHVKACGVKCTKKALQAFLDERGVAVQTPYHKEKKEAE
ncbi:hypothetical protein BC830DRAFT_1167384 [Chytriomyces sp. MP71]|nr:hypothetical protein BC830DRAFT_1167384 [Chytriomyces sp. MP71]